MVIIYKEVKMFIDSFAERTPHSSILNKYSDAQFKKPVCQATWHFLSITAVLEAIVICVEEFPSAVFPTQRNKWTDITNPHSDWKISYAHETNMHSDSLLKQ